MFICENFNFFCVKIVIFLHSRAHLEYGSELLLVVMSTMILVSLENISSGRRGKSQWAKNLLAHCYLKLLRLLHRKSKGTKFFCLRIQISIFCTEIGNGMMEHLHCACTARGTHKEHVKMSSFWTMHHPLPAHWHPTHCRKRTLYSPT